MNGYKIFERDWANGEFKYGPGSVIEENVEPKCGYAGLHFCTKLAECFYYFRFDPDYMVTEVEAIGRIDSAEDRDLHSTDRLRIVRKLSWQEVLDLTNTGHNCSGYANTGDSNEGHFNSGDGNSGDMNTGDYNYGYGNTGSYNLGMYNTGEGNYGVRNTGARNFGNANTGDHNLGSFNTGDWNAVSHSTGCFNTHVPEKIYMFNNPSGWTFETWEHSEAKQIMDTYPFRKLVKVPYQEMSELERQQDPEAEITGFMLREEQYSPNKWWAELSDHQRLAVMGLPNFDPQIFALITGIDTRQYSDEKKCR